AQILGGARGMFLFMYGKQPTYGLCSDTAVKPEVRPEYVRFTSTISKHQRQLVSPHVPARIAVVYSTSTALQYPDNTVSRYALGAFELFRNSHYQADILPSERCTPEGLAEYELIVLPSYCILKKPELEALKAFVAKGGKLMSFGKSLATDEYLNIIEPQPFQGIETRGEPIGGRTEQELSWITPKLAPYEVAEAKVTGLEKVSQIANDPAKIIMGEKLETKQDGTVLALNRDSYAAIMLAPGEKVVYCAFDSSYSPELRGLIEGITREYLGIKQKARLTRDEIVDPAIMTSLRQDYKDANRRYLLVINTLHRPRTLKLELNPGWKIEREDFHGLDKLKFRKEQSSSTVRLLPREVFLFELVK
ncbi:MAG: beta-galactosidase, partial [Planctomycetota bacterium]